MNVEEQLRRSAVDTDSATSAPKVAWSDIVRRAETLRRRRTLRRVGVLAATLTIVGAIAVTGAVWGRGAHQVVTVQTVGGSDRTGWRVFDTGPLAPRSDEVEVWTGRELIFWGGSTGLPSSPLDDGAAFDPQTGTWSRLPTPPLAARQDAIGVWTGTRLLVIAGKHDNTALANGAAYDPPSNTWKQIAPMPNGTAAAADPRLVVWTGQRLLLPSAGVAYNPTDNQWSTIAPLPANKIAFQAALWTGHDVIMIGVEAVPLNSGPPHVVGLAYDPTTNQWRRLPPSGISTTAVAATWDGTRVVVVSYDMLAESYQPTTNTWIPLPQIPLRFYECYPSAFTIAGHAYAQMCSGLAELDNQNRWTPIAYPPHHWGPGHGVPAGNAALMWGSAFPTTDSRFSPNAVVEYTPSDDTHRNILAGLAITTLTDGYKNTTVDAASASATETITVHLEGPPGACTITSTDNGHNDWATGELNRLDQLPGATRRQPPPTAFSGGPDFAVEIPPTAQDPQHHLTWALTTNDTVNIGCAQLSLVDRLARATHVNQSG